VQSYDSLHVTQLHIPFEARQQTADVGAGGHQLVYGHDKFSTHYPSCCQPMQAPLRHNNDALLVDMLLGAYNTATQHVLRAPGAAAVVHLEAQVHVII
jgi:hypothetical protein